jgi:hypothetical protein
LEQHYITKTPRIKTAGREIRRELLRKHDP